MRALFTLTNRGRYIYIFYLVSPTRHCGWLCVNRFRSPLSGGCPQRALGPSSKKKEKTNTEQRNHRRDQKTKKQHQTTKPLKSNDTTATTQAHPSEYTTWVDYRYVRNAIHIPISNVNPTTSGVTGISVTLFISLYPQFTPTTLGVIQSDIPTGGTPRAGRPPVGEPLWSGCAPPESILILTSPSILPCPLSYRYQKRSYA